MQAQRHRVSLGKRASHERIAGPAARAAIGGGFRRGNRYDGSDTWDVSDPRGYCQPVPRPRIILALSAVVLLASPLAVTSPSAIAATASAPAPHGAAWAGAQADETSQVAYRSWGTDAELATGRTKGIKINRDKLVLKTWAPRTATVGDTSYETGRWRSPWVDESFAFSELIASWQARTARNSYIEVEVRGRDASGNKASWDTLARWAKKDTKVRRTTFGAQSDDLAEVATDTWRVPGAGLARYQLRVTLARKAGSTAKVKVTEVGAMTSRVAGTTPPTSAPGVAAGITLDVPAYSQMIHRGHYPQWGNGGQAWCSPTSLSMVLGYYGRLPKPASHSWVPAGHVDPWVDATARATYDYGYEGAGNWAFNPAYAATRTGPAGPDSGAFVTRLRSLAEAEEFVAAGIPLVASIAFSSGELAGTPISASNGHLLVIVGFTATGDVIVNDPAAPTDATVRRVYDRAQFERVWQRASGRVVYVVHDAAHPLPASRGNW